MKIIHSTFALLLDTIVAATALPAGFEPFEALSVEDLGSLAAEVRQWGGSHAGQTAIQNGFLPGGAESALASLTPIPPSADVNAQQTRMQLPLQVRASKIKALGTTTTSENVISPVDTIARDANLRDLLKRYHDGKLRIAELEKEQPKASFSMQTPFALMTPEEFQIFVGRGKSLIPDISLFNTTSRSTLPSMTNRTRHLRQMTNPASVDWDAAGKVTTPRDQGSCNACTVFATIAAVESGYAIATRSSVPSLSEQDVISCGPLQGSCWTGRSLQDAMNWIVNYNGGSTCTLDSFPYGSWSGGTVWCGRYDDPAKACYKPDLGVVAYHADQFEDHLQLETLVAKQPVAVLINGSPTWFQHYSGGILMGNENTCSSSFSDLNHAVTIVGYGTSSDGINFWKAKNSWSHWWGENGFFRIEKGYQGATYGACGIEHTGMYPEFRAQHASVVSSRCLPRKVGYQAHGTVLYSVLVSSTSECCDICRGDELCKAVEAQEESKTCVLYSEITNDEPAEGNSVIYIVPKSKTNELCSPVENNVDYGGNDLMRLMTTSPGDCCDACIRNPDCLAYSWSQWNTGSCFLKTHRGSDINTHSPNADGTPYYVSGEAYKCSKATSDEDIAGQDLSSASATNYFSCCGICRSTSGCAAFTWTNYNGGTCWLKTGNANAFYHQGSISASASFSYVP